MLYHKETTEKVVQNTMNGLAIADFSTNFGSLLSSSVASSWEAVDSGKAIGLRELARAFYPGLADQITNNVSALIAVDIDVGGYVDALIKFYNDTRADDSVLKRDYDMTAIMEAVAAYQAK